MIETKHDPSILIVEDLDADTIIIDHQIKELWPDAYVASATSLDIANNEIDKNPFDLIIP